MSDDRDDKMGKIPTFEGNPRNVQTWWKKFGAFTTIAKIISMMVRKRDENLPEREDEVIDPIIGKGNKAKPAIRKMKL
jgi:hypothetical protein